jgi:hypothetical protein
MVMKLLFALLGAASVSALVSVSAVQAATMTFNHVDPDVLDHSHGDVYVENGITATGTRDGGEPGLIGAHDVPDTAHMNDGGTGFPIYITFTMDHHFDAISFDIIHGYNTYCSDTELTDCGVSFNNVGVFGIRDGLTVADDAFYSGEAAQFTYTFDAGFLDLDTLIIMALFPDLDEIGGGCNDFPCTTFNIDNVMLSQVSPVPLPPSALLLLTGLGLMVWRGSRKRPVRA